jgi:hypothetical protein
MGRIVAVECLTSTLSEPTAPSGMVILTLSAS